MKKLTGWLIYREKDAERNQHYIPFYEQAAKKRGATISLRFLESFSFCDGKLFYENEPANLPDFLRVRLCGQFLPACYNLHFLNKVTTIHIFWHNANDYLYVNSTIPIMPNNSPIICRN